MWVLLWLTILYERVKSVFHFYHNTLLLIDLQTLENVKKKGDIGACSPIRFLLLLLACKWSILAYSGKKNNICFNFKNKIQKIHLPEKSKRGVQMTAVCLTVSPSLFFPPREYRLPSLGSGRKAGLLKHARHSPTLFRLLAVCLGLVYWKIKTVIYILYCGENNYLILCWFCKFACLPRNKGSIICHRMRGWGTGPCTIKSWTRTSLTPPEHWIRVMVGPSAWLRPKTYSQANQWVAQAEAH